MRCCRKLFEVLLCLALSACLLAAPSARAGGIEVNRAEIRSGDEGYQLTADFSVNPGYEVQHALSLGIPLYFIGEFTLTRSRWYWLDEQIFQSEHTLKLSYNVLTRQYRISRGALFQNFASLDELLGTLARQSSALIPPAAVKKDGNYVASARFRLDTRQLPKMMQVNVLTSKDWDLDSGWYRWVIRPEDLSARAAARTD